MAICLLHSGRIAFGVNGSLTLTVFALDVASLVSFHTGGITEELIAVRALVGLLSCKTITSDQFQYISNVINNCKSLFDPHSSDFFLRP